MIQVDQKIIAGLSTTNRLICEAAIAKGWKVFLAALGPSHFFIDRGDNKLIHIFSATPPTVSYAAATLTNNKYLTYAVLKDNGIHQLDCIRTNDLHKDRKAISDFIVSKKSVVVKPIDGSHGKGVTVGVTNYRQFEEAYDIACRNKKAGEVVIQEQFMADDIHDIRVLCIANKFVAALERIPARVFGDGVHTVRQLIEIENDQPHRGLAYRSKLAKIKLELAEEFLGKRINEIPQLDQEFRVLGVANYGQGGETIDLTDDVPEWMKLQSEQASRILGLDVSGVDFMINQQLRPDLKQQDDQAVIIEVNKSPALSIHDLPTVGKNRGATDSYINFLASI